MPEIHAFILERVRMAMGLPSGWLHTTAQQLSEQSGYRKDEIVRSLLKLSDDKKIEMRWLNRMPTSSELLVEPFGLRPISAND